MSSFCFLSTRLVVCLLLVRISVLGLAVVVRDRASQDARLRWVGPWGRVMRRLHRGSEESGALRGEDDGDGVVAGGRHYLARSGD